MSILFTYQFVGFWLFCAVLSKFRCSTREGLTTICVFIIQKYTPSSFHTFYLNKLRPQHNRFHFTVGESEAQHGKGPAQGHKTQSSRGETELELFGSQFHTGQGHTFVEMILLKSYSLSCCHISWSTCRCVYSTCSSPREKLLEKLSQPTSRICGFSRVEAPVRAVLLCCPEMRLIPCWGHFQTKATEEDNCKALTVRMPGGLGQPWKCQPWHFQIAWSLSSHGAGEGASARVDVSLLWCIM